MSKPVDTPSSIDSEQVVLGAMMHSVKLANHCLDSLKIEDFFDVRNAIIFDAIRKLANENVTAEPIILSEELKSTGQISQVGGLGYLLEVASLGEENYYLDKYIEVLKNLSLKRKAIKISLGIVNLSKGSILGVDLIELALQSFHNAGTGQSGVTDVLKKIIDNYTDSHNLLSEIKERADHFAVTGKPFLAEGVATGFVDLDALIEGIFPDRLYIIGAHTSVGKTTFAINIAENVCMQGKKVLTFLLEMNQKDVVMRIVASQSEVPMNNIRKGCIGYQEIQRIEKALTKVDSWELRIDDSSSSRIRDIRAKIRRVKESAGVDLVIVDYLQLITTDSKETRQLEIATISRELKLMAQEFDVPIIALSQLNRKSFDRQDTRPKLSDLRESGAIEQDADCVMFLHREDSQEMTDDCKAELIVAKNRHGPIGTVPLIFKKSLSKFINANFM